MGLLIVEPGFWTTVQDFGRSGMRGWGVPVGGAFDRRALGLANALAGNPPDSAALELTLGGGVFEARCELGVALAGAEMEASIIDPEGRSRPMVVPSSTTLPAGRRLVLGRTAAGARAYLAIAGGVATEPRLGGRSSERPLRAGELLPARPGRLHDRRPRIVEHQSMTPFRCLPGPEFAALVDADALWSREYRVGSRSNRMGLRLEGAPADVAADAGRLSAPVTPGAVQATGGRLIVLGVSCGTVGGYPHVAQVISADLDRLGQLRPGDVLRFQRVSLVEARRLDLADRKARQARLAATSILARDLFELRFTDWSMPG